MVYTRILFNNIKEFTPNFIKTVPYAQTAKPVLGRKPQVGWRAFKDPSTHKLMRLFKKHILEDSANYQLFFFFVVFGVTSLVFYPSLWAYRTNNVHRSLDVAIAKEKEYKKKKAEEEEAEEADE